ncbi:centrosome spindle pole associated protein [Holotrichia oblita]|uniref:Centrosome spindle pole associated protein n=1 Tax=Holotrichia oblita TaxID=644536 RepID=A0ACB9SXY5_HOLOL|nr:centrosome spindle pole associated protein [Holotrichia oblita]
MFQRFWPWGKPIKPRGIGNLRLEEIFPDDELQKSKRMVGTLKLGKPGGGAPNASPCGKKIIRTREDPILRFQWGKDLRDTIDNTIRYKKNKLEQLEYKKQLDKLVAEKKQQQECEKKEDLQKDRASFAKTPPWGKPGPGGKLWRQPKEIGIDFLKAMGWSNVKTLDRLDNEHQDYSDMVKNEADNFKKITYKLPQYRRKNKENNKNFVNTKPYRLSALLSCKGNGVDLVSVIAKKRYPPLVPLSTTDVTKDKRDLDYYTKCQQENRAHLSELTRQMQYNVEHKKHMKEEEFKSSRRHFATWDSFLGRPGHGAPLSDTRKGHIERMLFPQMVPVGVA